jgi:hypothetical protein
MADLTDGDKKSFIDKMVAALNENEPGLAAARWREIRSAKTFVVSAEFAKRRKV